MRYAFTSLLLAASLVLGACQSPAPSASAHVTPPNVSATSSPQAPPALLVDVRTPGEFASGHVAGAVNIPLSQLGDRLSELGDRGDPIEVYCRSGNRSSRAAGLLAGYGFTSVTDLGSLSAAQQHRAVR